MNKKKIKIFSLSTIYPEKLESTAHYKFVHVLNSELVKLGNDVKVITHHTKGSLTNETIDSVLVKRFRYLPKKYELDSTSITELISRSKFSRMKVIIMIISFFVSTFFECLKEKPDILHAHWAFPAGFIAFIMSRIFRKECVVTIHGGIGLLRKFRLLKRIVTYGLNHSVVIAVSNYTKDELIRLGVKNENIIRIYVTPAFVKHVSKGEFLEGFRRKFTDTSHKIILFVGRLVELKGVEYLIRSLSQINDAQVHLVIVGSGKLLDQLKNMTKSLGLDNKVTFFGNATREEVGWLYDISDIFVCPSIIDSEGVTDQMPLVIPEAMESRLPVIATSVGGIVDVVKNDVNGLLVEQKNPTAIANAIERIISDKELEKRIIKNSQETVKEFLPETIARQHFEIYQKLINKKS